MNTERKKQRRNIVFDQECSIEKMKPQTRVPVSCRQTFKRPGEHTDPFSLPRHGGRETQIRGQHAPPGLPTLARLPGIVLGEGEGHDSGARLPEFKSKATQ